MARLKIRDEDSLSPETLEALEPVRMNGKLSPVYLEYANSEPALQAYLRMEQALVQGQLDERTLEAIKLSVSERTGCDFCLSVHSFKGKKAGLSEEQQLAILRSSPDVALCRMSCCTRRERLVLPTPVCWMCVWRCPRLCSLIFLTT